jgi:hypothetical protein
MFGGGYYWAGASSKDSKSGYRASVNIDIGGGHTSAQFGTTPTVAAASQAKASLWKADVQGDIGYDWAYGALALAARATFMRQAYDPGSYVRTANVGNTSTDFVILEPVAVARLGPRVIRGELQVGLSFPVWAAHQTGDWLPLILSLGLVSNF